MKLMKLTILAGAAAMILAASPAGALGFIDGEGGHEASMTLTSSAESLSTGASSNVSSSAGIKIPEPSNMLMLALGIVGLVAGRYAARKKRDRF